MQSYKEAFDKHEKRFGNNNDKVQRWKAGLSEVANLKGEHFGRNEYEYDFIERIVQEISRIINLQPLPIITNFLVCLEYRVQKVLTLLDGGSSELNCMVGICGIGGIGKSTIVRVVFNLITNQFEGSCFLPNVRENLVGNQGLIRLQQTLLFEILGGKNIEFMDVNKGCGIIKDRLRQKKVLLILDDVDERKQLQTLVGGLDWFGSGSKIIITTRDKHLLHVHNVKRIHEVEGLDDEEAQKLFTWNAFQTNEVDPSLMDISKRAVSYCQGLPLALDIIGCNLHRKKFEECKSALDMYEKILDNDIQKILKVSYDGLNEIEKMIFLDVACFFKDCELVHVMNILENGRGFDPKYGIEVLVAKSLIKIGPFKKVSMHDLIQKMGREIVRQESSSKRGEMRRLWFYEDILHVLEENRGTDMIEFIMLDLPEDEEVLWDGEAFKDMRNLKILIIKNAHFNQGPKHLPNSLRILDWTSYPSSSLPQDFHPRNLVILNLFNGLFDFDKALQKYKSLTCMELGNNKFLNRIPDVSGLQNLRKLNVSSCTNLIEIHDSVGRLKRLEKLIAHGCCKLKIFPCIMESTYLCDLCLCGCIKLETFPEILGNIGRFHISLKDGVRKYPSTMMMYRGTDDFVLRSGISMLPRFDKLMVLMSSNVSKLHIKGCDLTDKVLVNWLSCSLPNLKTFYLTDNTSIHKFLSAGYACFSNLKNLSLPANNLTDNLSSWIPWFPNLVRLDLSANSFTILPACIKQCHHLKRLILDDCHQLETIIDIPSIEMLSAMNCTRLTSQSSSMLLSQKLHDEGNKYLCLPGSKIPEWFDHRIQGSSLCFWFRKSFPSIALCFVNVLANDRGTMEIRVNSHKIDLDHFGIYFKVKESVEHVWLFDLETEVSFSRREVEEKEYIKDGWNHVEIEGIGWYIKWIGVHVHKENTDRENIIFGYTPTGSRNKETSTSIKE